MRCLSVMLVPVMEKAARASYASCKVSPSRKRTFEDHAEWQVETIANSDVRHAPSKGGWRLPPALVQCICPRACPPQGRRLYRHRIRYPILRQGKSLAWVNAMSGKFSLLEMHSRVRSRNWRIPITQRPRQMSSNQASFINT